MQSLYDTIRNYKKEDGSLLCDEFIRAPNRRQEPGYHDVSEYSVISIFQRDTLVWYNNSVLQVVSNPIDLLKIQQKLKTEEYEDVEEMQADMELLVSNARSYYNVTSPYLLVDRLYHC